MRRILSLLAAFSFTACANPKTIKKALSDEPSELLEVCWPKDGQVDFGASCENPHPPEWKKFPIKVKALGLIENTVEAVNVWNDALGAQVFQYTGSGYAAEIGVVYKPEDPKAMLYNGEIDYFASEGEPMCLVSMYADRVDTLVHELGHCLGLAHDPDNNRSVMYPSSGGRVMPRVELKDVQLLKKRYNL